MGRGVRIRSGPPAAGGAHSSRAVNCAGIADKLSAMPQTPTPAPPSNLIDPELLDILRCPLTRSRLRQEGESLVAEVGGLSYPVREGLPVMLVEEARLPAGVGSLAELKTNLQAEGQ